MMQTSELEFMAFAPNDVEKYWPDIEASIDLIPHTWTWGREETKRELLNGKLQAWAVGNKKSLRLMLFTQVSEDALQIIWACGDNILAESLPLLDASLENFARYMGVKKIEVIGRRGWEKALAPLGFKFDRIIVSRPVVDVRMN